MLSDVNINQQVMLVLTMILTTFIASIIKYITELIPLFFKQISELYHYTKNSHKTNKNYVTITSQLIKISNGTYHNSTIEYEAIMNHLNKQNINLYNIEYVDINRSIDMSQDRKQRFIVKTNKSITLEDDIIISFDQQICKSNANDIGSNNNITYISIIVSSERLPVSKIQNKIYEWTTTYISEKRKYFDDGQIYYLNLSNNKDSCILASSAKKSTDDDQKKNISSSEYYWRENVFISFKTFDNIFFEEKNMLLKKLNHFLNNESTYKRKGIPWNFGLLFHGSPGCGKTSCIKAISNYTKRHIVEINLAKIKTCTEFTEIFTSHIYNNKYIPANKKIIVLEDIDCMIKIIKTRKDDVKIDDSIDTNTNTNKNSIQSSEDLLKLLVKTTTDAITESFDNDIDDKLTLSCILNTIDGVLENYGRILIITTNYLDRLDDALIRPGRIDIKANFTKCTNKMYRDIIEHYYSTQLNDDIKFKDFKHSPAEVLENCCRYDEDMSKTILELTK